MLDPQNFSVNAGNSTDVYIDIDPDDGITLVGSQIYWRAYEQALGQPMAGTDPVIEKDNGDGGTIVVTDPDIQKLKVPLEPSDTADLLRNYYHEATVIDPNGNVVTVAIGIMTVMGTEYRAAATT